MQKSIKFSDEFATGMDFEITLENGETYSLEGNVDLEIDGRTLESVKRFVKYCVNKNLLDEQVLDDFEEVYEYGDEEPVENLSRILFILAEHERRKDYETDYVIYVVFESELDKAKVEFKDLDYEIEDNISVAVTVYVDKDDLTVRDIKAEDLDLDWLYEEFQEMIQDEYDLEGVGFKKAVNDYFGV